MDDKFSACPPGGNMTDSFNYHFNCPLSFFQPIRKTYSLDNLNNWISHRFDVIFIDDSLLEIPSYLIELFDVLYRSAKTLATILSIAWLFQLRLRQSKIRFSNNIYCWMSLQNSVNMILDDLLFFQYHACLQTFHFPYATHIFPQPWLNSS